MIRPDISPALPYNAFLNLYAQNLDLWLDASRKMLSGLGRSTIRNARTVEDGAEQVVRRATKTAKPRRKAAARKKSASRKKR